MVQNIIYITYQTSTTDQSILERVLLAKKSIENEISIHKNWKIVENLDLKRDATSIGDCPLPFIKDMIDVGIDLANNNDIIVISNADICVIPNITEKILNLCNKFGALCAHRYDFDSLPGLLNSEKDLHGREKYLGYDLFAFIKTWWLEKKEIFPDMILGRQAWDMIFARAVKENGGTELEHAIYHKTHISPWNTLPNLAGNDYNYRLTCEWISKHGGTIMGK